MKSKQAICKPQSGLTIIELLVVIAIAAVLMGYAAPSFNSMIDSVKVNLITHQIHGALLLTRSEAIKRNAKVTLIANNDNWKEGWQIKTASDVVVGEQDKFTTSNLTIGSTGLSDRTAKITFTGTGKPVTGSGGTQAGTIRVVVGGSNRNIVINFLGRTQVCETDQLTRCN